MSLSPLQSLTGVHGEDSLAGATAGLSGDLQDIINFSSILLSLTTRGDAGAISSVLTLQFFQQVPSK